jgi:hypothetical protein
MNTGLATYDRSQASGSMNADFWWSTPTARIDTYSRLPAGRHGIN